MGEEMMAYLDEITMLKTKARNLGRFCLQCLLCWHRIRYLTHPQNYPSTDHGRGAGARQRPPQAPSKPRRGPGVGAAGRYAFHMVNCVIILFWRRKADHGTHDVLVKNRRRWPWRGSCRSCRPRYEHVYVCDRHYPSAIW